MKKPFTRLLSGLSCGVLVFTSVLLFATSNQKASAACVTPLPTDKGTVTQTVALSAGTYTIWSRIRTATPANNAYYMNLTGSSSDLLCNATMGGTTLTANTWTWVKHATTVTATAGTYTMVMAGKDDGVEVDRVILTGDSACTPNNTAVQVSGVNYYGENCAPTDTVPPVVTVTAPVNNATLAGATTNVTGTVSDSSTISNISVYLDNSSTASATATSPGTGSYSISLNLSGLASGSTHTLIVKATDGEGLVGSSSQISFTKADTVAPVISAISSGSLSQTSATITWTTDEAADSVVEYGTTTSYGQTATLTPKVTSHSVNISGLTAGTTYHYRVKSKDAANNLATSGDGTFTTTAPTPDTTPPTVSLTAPTAGATLGGTYNLTATASDASGVAGVQFQVDSANVGAEDTSSPYSYSLNTTTLSNGTHTVKAIARDTAGNVKATTAINVTVSNSTLLAEDITSDGHVTGADFAVLAANFNRTTAQLTNPRADITGDGVVNGADFARLASKFNQ